MILTAEDLDFDSALALLDWQLGMGAGEAISDLPVDRYAVAALPVKAASEGGARASVAVSPSAEGLPPPIVANPVAEARAIAAACPDLTFLAEAIASFEQCDLKRGARQMVFAEGSLGAEVMIIGEAPSRDEDRVGRPFAGLAGELLDKMLRAIGLARQSPDPARSVYLTCALPWRAPENRDPSPQELAMMQPFLLRHIEFVQPKVLVLMGNHAVMALAGTQGITRLRGQWMKVAGLPALPMLHPADLLRQPGEKKRAWTDLLALRAVLDGGAAPINA